MKRIHILLASLTLLFSANAFADLKSSGELAVVLSGGNSDLETYAFKSDNTYKWDETQSISLKASYTSGEQNNVVSTEKWDITFRYDKSITDKMGVYVGETVESNRFAGFKKRFNTDLGGKYSYIKNEKRDVSMEFGFRYMVEQNLNANVADINDAMGRVFIAANRKHSDTLTRKFWVEYLPNFSNSTDYQINFEFAIEAAMSNLFSLKTAFLWNYDNQPVAGNLMHDYTFTTGLLASF
jgi:putative salt-induced outer membrane protein